MRYLLLVYLKKGHTESYYSNDIKGLREYAEFRKFKNYKIYELEEISCSKDGDTSIEGKVIELWQNIGCKNTIENTKKYLK